MNNKQILTNLLLLISIGMALPISASQPPSSSSSGIGQKRTREEPSSVIAQSLDEFEGEAAVEPGKKAKVASVEEGPNYWKLDEKATAALQQQLQKFPWTTVVMPQGSAQLTRNAQKSALSPLLHGDILPIVLDYAWEPRELARILSVSLSEVIYRVGGLYGFWNISDMHDDSVELLADNESQKVVFNTKDGRVQCFTQNIFATRPAHVLPSIEKQAKRYVSVVDDVIRIFSAKTGRQWGQSLTTLLAKDAQSALPKDFTGGISREVRSEAEQKTYYEKLHVRAVDPRGSVALAVGWPVAHGTPYPWYAIKLATGEVVKLIIPESEMDGAHGINDYAVRFSNDAHYAALGNRVLRVFDLKNGTLVNKLPEELFYFNYPSWKCMVDGRLVTDKGLGMQQLPAQVAVYTVDAANPDVGSCIVIENNESTSKDAAFLLHPYADSLISLCQIDKAHADDDQLTSSAISDDGTKVAFIDSDDVLSVCSLE